jgi:hypothetical protein
VKVKVDCKDNRSYIKIAKEITQKNSATGVQFVNEDGETLLVVNHDSFKAAEYWKYDYSTPHSKQ